MKKIWPILILLLLWTGLATARNKPPTGTLIKPGHPDASGLVGYWLFNEGTGSRVHDISGNENNGILYGTTWVSGIYGWALGFNGSSDYVNTSLTIPASAHTIIAWMEKNGTDAGLFISQRGVGGDTFLFWLRLDSSDQQMHYYNGTAIVDGIVAVPSNVWVSVAVTHDGNNIVKFYKNGIFDASRTLSIGSSSTETIKLQQTSGSDYANGTLGRVAIYNRALSAAEIMRLCTYPYAMLQQQQVWQWFTLFARRMFLIY